MDRRKRWRGWDTLYQKHLDHAKRNNYVSMTWNEWKNWHKFTLARYCPEEERKFNFTFMSRYKDEWILNEAEKIQHRKHENPKPKIIR